MIRQASNRDGRLEQERPRVFDDGRVVCRYPIVFNILQLHGEMGEKAGLNVADSIPGPPYRHFRKGLRTGNRLQDIEHVEYHALNEDLLDRE